MRGRGVVVYGPEASGTRYVTKLLERAAQGNVAVKHCSLPYGPTYIPLHELMAQVDRNDVRVLITHRRVDVLVQSQVANGHVSDEESSLTVQQRAYTYAVQECARMHVPFMFVDYSTLSDAAYATYVLRWSLPSEVTDEAVAQAVAALPYVDGDSKYMTEDMHSESRHKRYTE